MHAMIIRRVSDVMVFDVMLLRFVPRGYGATAARLTPDQKVGSSNLSALICARQAGERARFLHQENSEA